jgi:fused signal recognition particle receptor
MLNFRSKIKESLTRTRNSVFGQITGLFGGNEIDDELWDDLEALLIQADVGVETTLNLIETVRERVVQEGVTKPLDAQRILKEEMQHLLDATNPPRLIVTEY